MPDDFDYSGSLSRNPLRNGSTPILTMALIALCVILTAIFHLAPDDKSNSLYKLSHIILLNPDQIWNGHYLGLFTSFFIHLDIMHLAFNMYWTWKLGSTLETTIPPWKYLLFLVMATMVGSCCELLISGQTGAGASGAGYALMGLLWAGRGFHDSWRKLATRETMQSFLVWGVLCIVLTITGTFAVANGAHAGGLLFGLAVGHLFFSPRRKPIWASALVFLAVACALSLTWMPWSSPWNWYKGSQDYDRHHYRASIAYFERALSTGGEKAPLLYNIALSWYKLTYAAIDNHQMQEAEILDAQFNRSLEAAKAVAPPPSDANKVTDDAQLNSLENLKTKLDQALHPSK
jgi:membrane associated rhomboid family serine protease